MARKVFRAAIEKFPADGMMHKKICLFWEREGDLERAIEYCKVAVSRSVRDNTKNGFVGRLKRLQKKTPAASIAATKASGIQAPTKVQSRLR